MNDGGPAFPMPTGYEPRENLTTHFNEGMSLRDWFAGQALTIARDNCRQRGVDTAGNVAIGAYAIADAMLAEREKTR